MDRTDAAEKQPGARPPKPGVPTIVIDLSDESQTGPGNWLAHVQRQRRKPTLDRLAEAVKEERRARRKRDRG